MSKCENCIHYDVCDKQKITNHTISKSVCKHYKDKSLFVELPCKVGKMVYTYYNYWDKEGEIVPYEITNITITQNKKSYWTKKYRAMQVVCFKTIDRQINFDFDEIGKTIFLTKEQAERKLREVGV